jgi:hypothetical protein
VQPRADIADLTWRNAIRRDVFVDPRLALFALCLGRVGARACFALGQLACSEDRRITEAMAPGASNLVAAIASEACEPVDLDAPTVDDGYFKGYTRSRGILKTVRDASPVG